MRDPVEVVLVDGALEAREAQVVELARVARVQRAPEVRRLDDRGARFHLRPHGRSQRLDQAARTANVADASASRARRHDHHAIPFPCGVSVLRRDNVDSSSQREPEGPETTSLPRLTPEASLDQLQTGVDEPVRFEASLFVPTIEISCAATRSHSRSRRNRSSKSRSDVRRQKVENHLLLEGQDLVPERTTRSDPVDPAVEPQPYLLDAPEQVGELGPMLISSTSSSAPRRPFSTPLSPPFSYRSASTEQADRRPSASALSASISPAQRAAAGGTPARGALGVHRARQRSSGLVGFSADERSIDPASAVPSWTATEACSASIRGGALPRPRLRPRAAPVGRRTVSVRRSPSLALVDFGHFVARVPR